MTIIEAIEAEQLRKDIPDFKVGDTVKVWVKVIEGSRERLQAFEGTVIARITAERAVTFFNGKLQAGFVIQRKLERAPAQTRLDMVDAVWNTAGRIAAEPARAHRKLEYAARP